MYNKEHKVQFMCYLDNFGNTLGALLSHKHGIPINCNLREKNFVKDRTQLTITTRHQSKYGENLGRDGYGEDLKKTQEDIILESVFAKATPRFRDITHFEG